MKPSSSDKNNKPLGIHWLFYHLLISVIPILWSIFRNQYFYDSLAVSFIILIAGFAFWLMITGRILDYDQSQNTANEIRYSSEPLRLPAFASLLFITIIAIILFSAKIIPLLKYSFLQTVWSFVGKLLSIISYKTQAIIYTINNFFHAFDPSLINNAAFFVFLVVLLFLVTKHSKNAEKRFVFGRLLRIYKILIIVLQFLAVTLGIAAILKIINALLIKDLTVLSLAVIEALSTIFISVIILQIYNAKMTSGWLAVNSLKLFLMLTPIVTYIGIGITSIIRYAGRELPNCKPRLLIVGLILIFTSILLFILTRSKHGAENSTTSSEFVSDIKNLIFRIKVTFTGPYLSLLLFLGVTLVAFPEFICETITQKKPVTVDPKSINILRVEMCSISGKSTSYYDIKTHPNNEVIKDKKGKYFVIKLIDAKRKEELYFNLGKYTLNEFSQVFNESMERVRNQIINIMSDANINYKIYVKGSADIKGDHQKVINSLVGIDNLTISFLQKNPLDLDGNQWIQIKKNQTISKTYDNRQLPNLRAWYTTDKLSNLNITAEILDGEVTQRESDKDRNALILLYWPDENLCKQ